MIFVDVFFCQIVYLALETRERSEKPKKNCWPRTRYDRVGADSDSAVPGQASAHLHPPPFVRRRLAHLASSDRCVASASADLVAPFPSRSDSQSPTSVHLRPSDDCNLRLKRLDLYGY